MHGNIALLVSFILTIVWVIVENKKIPKGQSSDEPFSLLAKIGVGVLCAVFPIVIGPIFYYSLHKKFPKKARYANWASIILFIVEVGAIFYFFQIPLTRYVH